MPGGLSFRAVGVESEAEGRISAKYLRRTMSSDSTPMALNDTTTQLCTLPNNLIVMENSGIYLPECVISAEKLNRNPGLIPQCIFPTNPITITLAARDWSYAPNPTHDAVMVQTPEARGNILVYAMNGSTITQVKVTEAVTRVVLADYTAGIYFMYFENTGLAQPIGKVVLIKN